MIAGQITAGSSIFYCALSVLVLILSIAADKTKKRGFAVFLVILLCFVAGFRAYTVGSDTKSYISIFAYVGQGGVYQKDPGFGILCKLLLMICNNYTFLLLVFALITYGFTILRFWELRGKISFSVAVFSFYSFYFFETMNAMRQFCAVAIVFWATRYLQKRKYLQFIIAVILATLLFHRSALLSVLFLGIELFSWKNLEKSQKILLTSIIAIGLIFSRIIISKLGVYIEQYVHYFNNFEVNLGFRVPALLIILLVSFFLYRRREDNNGNALKSGEQGETYLLRNSRIYYLMSCVLGSIGYFFEFMGRIGYYFVFFQFVYFGILVQEKYWQYRWILKAMIYIITLYILYNYIFVLNGDMHHPYYFIWDT